MIYQFTNTFAQCKFLKGQADASKLSCIFTRKDSQLRFIW